MTIKLSASQRLRVGAPGGIAVTATGVETTLHGLWFLVGFKRTSGDPTTVGDLIAHFPFQLIDCNRGSFTYNGPTSTFVVKCSLEGLNHGVSYSAANAGDQMYLLACTGLEAEPGSDATFDSVKSLGALRP